jgi:hypothetical protein
MYVPRKADLKTFYIIIHSFRLVWTCDLCCPLVYDKLKVSNQEILGESHGRGRVYQQRLQVVSSIPETGVGGT